MFTRKAKDWKNIYSFFILSSTFFVLAGEKTRAAIDDINLNTTESSNDFKNSENNNKNTNNIINSDSITLYANQHLILNQEFKITTNNLDNKIENNIKKIYIVKKGDTLYRIAVQNKISLNQLIKMNKHIKNPDLIYPGDKLYLQKVFQVSNTPKLNLKLKGNNQSKTNNKEINNKTNNKEYSVLDYLRSLPGAVEVKDPSSKHGHILIPALGIKKKQNNLDNYDSNNYGNNSNTNINNTNNKNQTDNKIDNNKQDLKSVEGKIENNKVESLNELFVNQKDNINIKDNIDINYNQNSDENFRDQSVEEPSGNIPGSRLQPINPQEPKDDLSEKYLPNQTTDKNIDSLKIDSLKKNETKNNNFVERSIFSESLNLNRNSTRNKIPVNLFQKRVNDSLLPINGINKNPLDRNGSSNNFEKKNRQSSILDLIKMDKYVIPFPKLSFESIINFEEKEVNGNKSISYIWPTKGVITSMFNEFRGRNRRHKGIDIANAVGTPIYASATGEVVFSGWNSGGYGNLIILQHENGDQTFYAHNLKNRVFQGQKVLQGQWIADMGSTGFSTGSHLHFEIRKNVNGNLSHVNPKPLLIASNNINSKNNFFYK